MTSTKFGLIVTTVLCLCIPAFAQLPLIQEAEACKIVCKAGSAPGRNMWARCGQTTPDFWGKSAGDSVTWTVNFRYPHKAMKLGVRYSYAELAYKSAYPTNPNGTLQVVVDNGKPIDLKVPDTGSWGNFETAVADLPSLKAGSHQFKITAPRPDSTRNLDTLVLFEGKPESLPVVLRRTKVAESPLKHFIVRMTPGAKPCMTNEQITAEFDRIFEYFKEFMGFTPPEPVVINVAEDEKWPRPGAGAFMNGEGIWLQASIMHTEQGNWLHEMTHMFYYGRMPGWFEETSVRVLTIAVWIHNLVPGNPPLDKDAKYQQYMLQGHDLIDNPDKIFDSLEPVLVALIVKYGERVYSRFFRAVAEAAEKGEIEFALERPITQNQLLKYMSQAAGEDVTPIFRRWKEFRDQPGVP